MSNFAYAMTPIAAVAAGAAVRSAAEGRWVAASLGLTRALLAMALGYAEVHAGYAVHDWEDLPRAVVIAGAVFGALVSVLGYATTRQWRTPSDTWPSPRASSVAWIGVIAVESLTCASVLSRSPVYGCVALILAPLLSMVLAMRGAPKRRRWLPLIYLLGPALIFSSFVTLALFEFQTPYDMGFVAIRCWVIAVPIVTLLLLAEMPARSVAIIGVAVGSLALLALVGFAFNHVERCAGELVATGFPSNWKALPVIAQGDGGANLGDFHIRYRRYSYKNYPAPYEDAELWDPRLCFASALSLESWFGKESESAVVTHEPAMYRSSHELHLRHEPTLNRYFVSAHSWSDPNYPIVAFERKLKTRVWFDSRLSLGLFLMGVVSLGLGSYQAWRQRRHEWLAPLVFAAFIPILYCAITQVFDVARPGHEVRGGESEVFF